MISVSNKGKELTGRGGKRERSSPSPQQDITYAGDYGRRKFLRSHFRSSVEKLNRVKKALLGFFRRHQYPDRGENCWGVMDCNLRNQTGSEASEGRESA